MIYDCNFYLLLCSCIDLYRSFNPLPVASGGGGERRNVPPPRNRKNCCRNLVLPSRGLLSERSQKSKKYLVKNREKSQFCIEILIKKSQDFLEIFKNSLHFWQVLQAGCLALAAQSKSLIRSHGTGFFYKFHSIFSKKCEEFSCHFQ